MKSIHLIRWHDYCTLISEYGTNKVNLVGLYRAIVSKENQIQYAATFTWVWKRDRALARTSRYIALRRTYCVQTTSSMNIRSIESIAHQFSKFVSNAAFISVAFDMSENIGWCSLFPFIHCRVHTILTFQKYGWQFCSMLTQTHTHTIHILSYNSAVTHVIIYIHIHVHVCLGSALLCICMRCLFAYACTSYDRSG